MMVEGKATLRGNTAGRRCSSGSLRKRPSRSDMAAIMMPEQRDGPGDNNLVAPAGTGRLHTAAASLSTLFNIFVVVVV